MRLPARAGFASIALLTACASVPPAQSPPPPPAPPLLALPAAATPVAPPPEAAAAPATADLSKLSDEVRTLQAALTAGHGAVDAVTSLTTEVGARAAGSPSDKLAVAWALRAMEERGLTNVHAEPVKVPRWQRGVETAAIVAPVQHTLAITALGWSTATPPKGLEGEVVRLESLDALKNADPKTIAGKIVFLDVKMERTASGAGYGAAVPARGKGPLEAKKKGALAFVIRSIATDESRFPHTGSMSRQEDPKLSLPAGAISVADANLLDRVIAAHGTVRLSLNLGPKWFPEADSANVVGEVAGTASPAEVVLLGAHLDSWDLGQGAIDDGAGCAIVLEAAHAIGALPKKARRTVRVVLFAAEEDSLAGGKQYAKAHVADAGTIVVAMEADSGTDRVISTRYGGGAGGRARFLALGTALEPLGVKVNDGAAYGGADVSPLRTLGVPLLDLEQDFTHYFDTHHTANDTLERVDPVAIQQASAAFATAAWTAATMDGDFGRAPPEDHEHK